MKIYITLIISLLIFSSLRAQTENCVSDEVQGEDPTSCCNDLIITAPINPVNTEYPALLNQFDWLAPTVDLPAPQILTIDIGNGEVNAKHPFLVDNTNYYWFSSFRSGQNFPLETHGMHPKYGWELMHMNLGLGLYGDGQATGQPNPYMLFYNKYTGKLRMVVSPSAAATSFDNANVDLRIIPTSANNGLLFSALLNRYNGQQKALDQSTAVSNISSHLPFTNLNNWSIADFQLAYDPCSCNLPSRIAFDFTERNFSQVEMSGRLVGVEVPLASSGSSPLNFGDDFLSSVFVDGFFEGNKDNVGMLVYDQIDQDVASAYVSDAMKFYGNLLSTAASLGGIKGIKVPINLLANGGGIDTVQAPLGAVIAAGAGFASKQINPPAPKTTYLEAELAIAGTINDETNSSSFADFELLSPGSFTADHDAVAWDLHPFLQ